MLRTKQPRQANLPGEQFFQPDSSEHVPPGGVHLPAVPWRAAEDGQEVGLGPVGAYGSQLSQGHGHGTPVLLALAPGDAGEGRLHVRVHGRGARAGHAADEGRGGGVGPLQGQVAAEVLVTEAVQQVEGEGGVTLADGAVPRPVGEGGGEGGGEVGLPAAHLPHRQDGQGGRAGRADGLRVGRGDDPAAGGGAGRGGPAVGRGRGAEGGVCFPGRREPADRQPKSPGSSPGCPGAGASTDPAGSSLHTPAGGGERGPLPGLEPGYRCSFSAGIPELH